MFLESVIAAFFIQILVQGKSTKTQKDNVEIRYERFITSNYTLYKGQFPHGIIFLQTKMDRKHYFLIVTLVSFW